MHSVRRNVKRNDSENNVRVPLMQDSNFSEPPKQRHIAGVQCLASGLTRLLLIAASTPREHSTPESYDLIDS